MKLLSVVTVAVALLLALAPGARAAPQSATQIDTNGIDLFDRGQAAHKAGRLDEAIKLYDESIAVDPEFWGSHYQRGVALLQLGRAADAERSLRRAVELEDEFAAAHAALGDALLRLDRLDDAERELSRALTIDPSLAAVRYNYASVLWRRKAFKEAERELARMEADGKANAASRYLHGEALAALGRAADATKAFDAALALDPGFAPALVGRGVLRSRSGDEAGAIADLTAANRIAPSEQTAALLAGLTARAGSTGDPAAIDRLRARIAASPSDREARLALADALARAGKLEEAKRELDGYVEASPDDAVALDAAGDVLLDAAPLEAARYYARATNNAPGDVEYRLKLGSALVRAGRHADAVEALEPALARAAERREAHAGLAASYYGLGRYLEAAREFEWLAEKDPKATTVQFYLGASLDRIGDCRGAIDAFRKFLSSADPIADKARIDDVNIRLPAIERQLESGGCKKLEKARADKKRS